MLGNDRKNGLHSIAKFSGIAFEIVAITGLSLWGGYFIDQKLHTMPLFLISCVVISFVAVMMRLWVRLKKDK